MEIQSNITAS